MRQRSPATRTRVAVGNAMRVRAAQVGQFAGGGSASDQQMLLTAFLVVLGQQRDPGAVVA